MRRRLLTGIMVPVMALSLMMTPAVAAEVSGDESAQEETVVETEIPLEDDSVSTTEFPAGEKTGSEEEKTDAVEETGETASAQDGSEETSDISDAESEEDGSEDLSGQIMTFAKEYEDDEDGDEDQTSGSEGVFESPDGTVWYYYVDGKVVTSATVAQGTVDGTTAWWYVNGEGMVDTSYTGFATNENGTWYVESGKVTKKANGVYKDTAGAIGSSSAWYYVLNSKVQYDFTGLADYSNASGWWYITKGKVDRSVTTVAKNKNGWWYVENGKVDKSYTGFATNENGSWYMENGKLRRDQNTVIKDTKGALGSTSEWYYVVGSKVQTNFTGLADYSNASGWWYVTNGRVDRSVTTVAKNKNGWWYVKNGKVDKSYTGFATNENGSWYMENGKLKRDQNTVIKDTKGALGAAGEWYYVIGSKVQTGFTGLADYKNASGWWYITNGMVDRSVNTVAENKNGWWYVVNGKVKKDFTGLADYSNEDGWWYITNGKVDTTYNGLAKNKNGWYYLTDGKVDRSYTGFAENENGCWYMESGKLTRTVNSVVKDETGAIGKAGEWYYVIGSKVQFDFTGLADYSNESGWWYITNGVVDRSFTGVASNKNGQWYIKDGKVQQSYSGEITVNGTTYLVENGKAAALNSVSGVFYMSDEYEYDLAESDTKYAGKDTTQLAAPVFTGSQDSNCAMHLQWDAVEGAAKYRVFRKAYGDSSWTILGDTTSTSYTDTPPSSKNAYFYTVRCLDSNGEYASDYIKGYSGSAVAHYAMQFTGCPYVYGGISLTNGCDCSGFVMQVYAHFGVYLPHYSGDQINCGSEVSYSSAQAGDIIGRAGHTTIYLGNGWIIHARNESSGICITSVSSTSYTNIRRIY